MPESEWHICVENLLTLAGFEEIIPVAIQADSLRAVHIGRHGHTRERLFILIGVVWDSGCLTCYISKRISQQEEQLSKGLITGNQMLYLFTDINSSKFFLVLQK